MLTGEYETCESPVMGKPQKRIRIKNLVGKFKSGMRWDEETV